MNRPATAIETSAACPSCERVGKWATDSSRLRAGSDGFVLNLDCQSCGKNFDLDMVTGRTVHGRGRREPTEPPKVEPKPVPAAPRNAGPKKDNWTHGGEGVAAKTADENWAFEPLLPDAPPEQPGLKLPMPAPAVPASGFRPHLPESEPATKAEPAGTRKTKSIAGPARDPEPISSPEEPPVMSTAHRPNTGFWSKFSSLPLWQQWGIIVVVIALIGTAIFLSPLGESKPVEAKP